MRHVALGIGIVALTSCHRDNAPNLPPSDVVLGAGFADAASPCERTCAILEGLGCPEGKPTRAGGSCLAACETNDSVLPVECIGAAHSVAELQSCGVRCSPRADP